eukprot:10015671-Lingulodinium_polyedra.AAC.1
MAHTPASPPPSGRVLDEPAAGLPSPAAPPSCFGAGAWCTTAPSAPVLPAAAPGSAPPSRGWEP